MKTSAQPTLFSTLYIYFFVGVAMLVHYLIETKRYISFSVKVIPEKSVNALYSLWNGVKTVFSLIGQWIVNHRWRGTVFGYEGKQKMVYISFPPHPKRKVMELTFDWSSPWDGLTRWFGFCFSMDSWPNCTKNFGFCVPYLFGCNLSIRYSKRWWEKKYGVGYPRHYTEYSFSITSQYITYVHGEYMDGNSFEIPWKKRIRDKLIEKRGTVIEPDGWYSAIIPIPSVGDFPSQMLRARCKELQTVTVTRRFFMFKSTQMEKMWTVDIVDGVVVPADHNVYEDQVSTGVTFKDVSSHQEAIQKMVELVVAKRKRRPKTNARSVNQ